jgi:ssRNA-specific RNase YbeY (16S rRNA maturation enzyme)
MKKLIAITLLLMTLSFNVFASMTTQQIGNLCDSYTELAVEIMKARQANIQKEKVKQHLIDEVSLVILDEAYNHSIQETKAGKERITKVFSQDFFITCITTLTEGKEA